MKGLELCKQFFFDVGFPKIKEEIPEVLPYLAVGLGGGSQCHGNDDEVSRDHGWGPGFAIWLEKDIKTQFERDLKRVLNSLPKKYLGYGWADDEEAEHSCPILDIDDFMNVKVGVKLAPVVDVEWLAIPEEKIFEVTHFPVFYDAAGEITKRFNSFKKYYPDDVWIKRLAYHLQEVWKWNVQYVTRSVNRGDIVTAGLLWGKFAEHTMKVGFLLNREYAPYEKWLYTEFRKLSLLGNEVGDLIARGIHYPSEISKLTEVVEDLYIHELERMGFEPTEVPDAAYPKSTIQLLEYSIGMYNSIKNPEIKRFS
ncbi:hypothetical protein FHS19_001676 [Paenibacillus rhizosphaerae]|uniref:DUF4037 domain-containing protein n=1 Tax=Paenibacillus rhizosphaerae TaxID=297318 RepID=A0A839TK53_9BACL|nr:DUF4037 domain-containing protein [Paenibacillus rhizosphaerae]MBB3127022.1 hypothetical protein [Paenibacillus rhizosphaerae]